MDQDKKGSKLFQDSVHGAMRFCRLLVKIIDTREFQRLRNIKQLSTTYLVYPAAAHNRFEHSLGVCWLAGELLSQLQKNSPREWKSIFSDGKGAEAILAVQIAALLHDIGHGPWSHTWENFLKSSGLDWDHESTSCKIFDILVYKNGQKPELTELGEEFQREFRFVHQTIQFIKDVIQGHSDGYPKEKAFLFQVVANKINDIDVDKWDYFLRDALHLNIGIPFDHRRLMRLSKIIEKDGEFRISFRDVEKYSIQGMFRVRADLHIRAYQHRVAKCLEVMLIDALIKADKIELPEFGNRYLSHVHDYPQYFIKLTDSIQEYIMNSMNNKFDEARAIFNRILSRDLYQTVEEFKLDVKQTPEQKKKNEPPSGLTRTQLTELENKLGGNCAISQVYVNQGKFYEPMENVIFYNKEGKVVKSTAKNLDIRMDLPFVKLFVFDRTRGDCDHNQMKEVVKTYLQEAGVQIAV